MPLFFTSNLKKEEVYKQKNYRMLCESYTMEQAAMATSAAPTYFKPYLINPTVNKHTDRSYTLIDGGVFANNPTSIGIIEVMNSYKQRVDKNITLDDVLVVSIGTGARSRRLELQEIETWGQIKWVEPLINIALAGQSEVVDYQMEQLLFAKNNYYRFQPQFPEVQIMNNTQDLCFVNDAMDDTSAKNITNLRKITADFILGNIKSLNSLCDVLIKALDTRILK
jgi:patatin-like phospholipase/acyl hydrolase